jgi:hypothetical protein
MNLAVRHLSLCAGLLLGVGARAETKLAATSPFLPPDGAAAASAGENTPLELRGILRDGDGYRFSIFDPARKSGQWVRLNEPGHDFTVKAHDVAHDSVTLDFQGRVLTLPLHSAKVVGLTPAAQVTLGGGQFSGPMPTNGGTGVGPVPRPTTPEDAARFNRAVEEINRRRAARERGMTPAPK